MQTDWALLAAPATGGGGASPAVTITNAVISGDGVQFDFTYDDNGTGHDKVDITFKLVNAAGTERGTSPGWIYTFPPDNGGDEGTQTFKDKDGDIVQPNPGDRVVMTGRFITNGGGATTTTAEDTL